LRARLAWLLLAAIPLLMAGCALLFPPDGVPIGTDYTVHVFNNTTLPVQVAINGRAVGVAAPQDALELRPSALPRLPWSIDATTPTGRLLLHVDVAPGSVVDVRNLDGSGSHTAPYGRLDLSCGQLRIVIGEITPSGPAPGPGLPGDCLP